MLTTFLSSLRGHAGRLVATGLAVLFAVAFIAGTFAFTDTARQGYFDTYARVARGIDVSVRPTGPELSAAQLDAVRAVPGINAGEAGFAVSADGPASLRAFDLRGRPPAAGQALVDAPTAAHERWQIGDTV